MPVEKDNLEKFLEEVTEIWVCPQCAANGITASVKLYQAQSDLAVYFCETPKCNYPQTDQYWSVDRSVIDRPLDAGALEELGLPESMLLEGELTFAQANELLLAIDAYNQFDDWIRLEKEMQIVKDQIDEAAQLEKAWVKENVRLNPKCTPLNRLRYLPEGLLKFAKHVIPNIEEVVELLRLDVL